LQVAADAGHDDAAFRLAQMFLHSRGLSLSYRSAFLYLQKPADNGHAQACFELGLMFERGCGVECIDEVQALMWFNEALKNGDVRAAAKIDYLSLWAEFRAERDVSEKPQPSFFLTTSTLHSELGNNTDTISKLNKSIATTTHLSSSQHMAFLLANSSPTAKMNQTIRSTNNATLSSPGAGAALNTTGSNFNTTSFISASTSLLAPLPPTFGIFDVMPKLTATRRVTVDCRTEWRLNGAVPTVNTSFGERFVDVYRLIV
jgi:TPR repeat protein